MTQQQLFGVGLRLSKAEMDGQGGLCGQEEGPAKSRQEKSRDAELEQEAPEWVKVVEIVGWARQAMSDLNIRLGSRVLEINGAPCGEWEDEALKAALLVGTSTSLQLCARLMQSIWVGIV